MSLLRRWTTFNLVGALGMGIQLATLSCLNRLWPGHYLVATAAALELTLLHNFCWHRRTTWRDRTGQAPVIRQLGRFHLTNGLISLGGNLVLMHLLVHNAHLPVLLSNALAILCCSLVNFGLSHAWTFRSNLQETAARVSPQTPRAVLALSAVLLTATGAVSQQTPAQGTSGQSMQPADTQQDYGVDSAYANVFFGPAFATGSGLKPTGIVGVTIGQYFTRAPGKGLIASPQFELGVIGPISGGYSLDGFIGFDVMFSAKLSRAPRFLFATAGYTRLFVTGNAVNFGVGLDLGKHQKDSLLRLEVRDYFLFTGPQQHVVGLRLAFGKLIAD